MVSHPVPDGPLPTLDRLGATVSPSVDVKKVATEWFNAFSLALSDSSQSDISTLFIPEAFWRDMLALTWDFRTFSSLPLITDFVKARIPSVHPTSFKLREDKYTPGLQQPYADIAWIQLIFDFETDVGTAMGIARLVPTASGEWKAHCVFTNLEDLKGFPEQIGSLRNQLPNHGEWEGQRQREVEFIGEDGSTKEPTVLIVGGGQSGLDLAARLKSLNVSVLVVERNKRIGDNWRGRYEALCLHDPVCKCATNASDSN